MRDEDPNVNETQAGVSRREFLKISAVTVAVLTGLALVAYFVVLAVLATRRFSYHVVNRGHSTSRHICARTIVRRRRGPITLFASPNGTSGTRVAMSARDVRQTHARV